MPSDTPRYSAALRYGHWVAAILVILAYVAVVSHEFFPRGSPERMRALQSHFLIGIVILLITIPRIFVRLRATAPPITPPLARVMWVIAKITHIALYAFLIVQPLMGITARMLEGRGIPMPFGEVVIPSFIGVDKDLGKRVENAHVMLGTIFYFVIGLHILASIYHAVIRRDNVLRRML